MTNYRKFMEPEYGEPAPEVIIYPSQEMDMEHLARWRKKNDYESVAEITEEIRHCICYPNLMKIDTEDVKILGPQGNVNTRIYKPEGEELFPVLIYYHGGSFSMNSIEVYEYVCRYLAYTGNMIVVAPDYHLAPEYKFPAGLNEAYETLVWTKNNIGLYYGDEGNISVAGDSSGGNFAAAVSIMARDQEGPKIRKQILFYPLTTNYEEEITDSEQHYQVGYFLNYNCMNNPMAHYFENEEDVKNSLASPLLEDNLKGLPPACFISAECDPLLDQGLQYAAKLQDAGVKVEYHILKGMLHGFINPTYGKSFEALELAADFVNN